MKRPLIMRVAVLCGATGLAAGVVAAASGAGQILPSRTVADGAVCKGATACLSVQNDGRGGAIEGTITQNHNKDASGNPIGNYKIFGGVKGVDTSTNLLDSNAGVYGVSANGSGVTGVTTFDSSKNGFAQSGIFGIDNSKGRETDNQNSGVFGWSTHNTGVFGYSIDNKNGIGVFGEDATTLGVLGSSNGEGVFGYGGDHGVGYALEGFSPTAASTALAVVNISTGNLIQGFGNGSAQTQVLLVDNVGNMTIAGTLTQNGSPQSLSATSTGRKVIAYTPQQSVRTMEDVGEAQLVAGRAIVPLEASFASAIAPGRPYLVFITPQGDTSSPLYVTQKTATGFVVREHGGSANVGFDYRIVAQPYGTKTQRLPRYDVATIHATAEQASLLQRVVAVSHGHRAP